MTRRRVTPNPDEIRHAAPGSPRVVVAHEAEAIREAALRVVRDVGFEGVGVADGESARVLVLSPPYPAALVVDVALPAVLGYKLCEEIRSHGVPTRVVLVASVYSKTAYKRRPSSLYGADDYVEQHHIPDQLAPKLLRLVPMVHGGHAAPHDVHNLSSLTLLERSTVENIRSAGEGRMAFRYATYEEGIARARRLARLILSDVILYNGALIDEGIRNGDLETRLGTDLDTGRELFALRVPAEIASVEDFLGAALAEFVAVKTSGKENNDPNDRGVS
jgi:CheY-like chemotaxis protein